MDDLTKAVHTFLFNRDVETTASRAKGDGHRTLKEHLLSDAEGVREDENGHKFYDFEKPLTIGGVEYKAISAQRRLSASIDLARTEELVREKGLYEDVFPPVTTRRFDEDALYAANQLGYITDEELDGLITENVTYAIVPVKS
jgi:hypothetical protein